MRLIRANAGFAVVLGGLSLLALWLWGFGGSAQITDWAAAQQRAVQGDLAGALRATARGEGWAVASLLGLCFAYGFFHAAGPGHGKLVMGGYALGEDVPRVRLAVLTLAGSLGQAVTAVALVGFGALVLGWGRAQMTDVADGTLAAFSASAIVLVGLWLVWRGVRRLGRSNTHDDHGHHHHDHAHNHDHSSCGHAHGPDPADVARVSSLREAVALVSAVAIRPCTGAIFVLILTLGMGVFWAGVLGAIVMSLGTALLTLGVAFGARYVRGGLVDRLNGSAGARAMAMVEICAGLMVAIVATQVVLRLT